MANEWTPDHPDGLAEPQITVVVHRDRPPRITRRAAKILAAAAVSILAAASLAIAGLPAGGQSHPSGVPGAGGSFGYPFRCVSVAFAPNGSGVARATATRAGLCDRYARYVSATFHRVDGGWRLTGR